MGGSVRLLTANLWNGAVDARGFAELVERSGADVVATQEMTPEQSRELERVLAHGRLEPARDHSGMGLALRHPGRLQSLPLPERPAHIARLDPSHWAGLPTHLEILNVHITAPHVWPPWRTFPARRRQLAGLKGYLAAGCQRPRVLAGDLNATPVWPLYRRLAERLADAAHLAANGSGGRPRPTWAPAARGPRLLRIDHVLVERIRVERLEVVALPGGDHSGVLAELAPLGELQDSS